MSSLRWSRNGLSVAAMTVPSYSFSGRPRGGALRAAPRAAAKRSDVEEVPVGAAEDGAQHDQRHPQDDEAEQEGDDGELALVEGVVAGALRVEVDVGDGDEADDNHGRQHDAGHPGVVVDEHLLQTEE